MEKKLSRAERERRAEERRAAKALEQREEAVTAPIEAAADAAEAEREEAVEAHEAELDRSEDTERDFRKDMAKSGHTAGVVERDRLKAGKPVNVGIEEPDPHLFDETPAFEDYLARPAETLRLRDALEGARLSEADKATDLARTVEPVQLAGEVPERHWRRELVLNPALSEADKVYLAEREAFYRGMDDAKAGFVPHDDRGGRTIAPRVPVRAVPARED